MNFKYLGLDVSRDRNTYKKLKQQVLKGYQDTYVTLLAKINTQVKKSKSKYTEQ